MLKRFAKLLYSVTPFKPVIMHMLRRVWLPPENIYRHLHFRGPITLGLPNRAQLRVHHFGNEVENDLFWAGFANGWEKHSLLTWLWLVRDADVIFDIGANTGIYALSAQATRPEATVMAFEPVKRIHAKLAENIALNGYPIKALNIALSKHNGTVSLYDPGGEHAYSASINADMLGGGTVAYDVDARTIDDLMSEYGIVAVDVMKIDVEMHEPEVIAGAVACLKQNHTAMLVEILDKKIGEALVGVLPDYVFYEIGVRLVKTTAPGTNTDRNYLVLPKGDRRVAQLGDATAIATLRAWI